MTITEDIRAIVERVKSLGPEWNHAASKLEDAVRAAETARAGRIAFLGHCLTETTQRLAKLKEELRTLRKQIAKLEAERARLESQTGTDIVREAVAEQPTSGELVYTAKPPGQVLVDGKPEDPFVPGLPPERLRKVWAEWEQERGPVYKFEGKSYQVSTDPGRRWFSVTGTWEARYRPHGTTRAEVEAMADAAEKQGELEPPALLDLRGLKVGTECWTTDRIKIPHTDVTIRRGVAFTIVAHCEQPSAENEYVRVQVADTNDIWTIQSIVPARVVEVPK